MKQKLHVASRLFIKDPYVIRVTHPESTMSNLDLSKFRQYLRSAKLTITDTWGYSNPNHEICKTEGETVQLNNIINFSIPTYECYSYWAFTNEMDALQFRLKVGEQAKQVHMWSKGIKFTITEYINDEDTSS